MDHHLGGEAAEGRSNSRNGYGRKTVLTGTGKLWDCQEFRVRAMTTGRKEPAHGTPQSTPYPGRAAGPAPGRP